MKHESKKSKKKKVRGYKLISRLKTTTLQENKRI